MRNLKKWCAVLFIVLLVCGLTGCQSTRLSEDFDEKEVKTGAEKVIELVNAGDFETLNDELSEQMKLAMPDDVWVSVKKIVDGKGAFQSFAKENVVGSKDKDTDEPFATAVVLAEYENGKIQYTISFDREMKVSGFYLK